MATGCIAPRTKICEACGETVKTCFHGLHGLKAVGLIDALGSITYIVVGPAVIPFFSVSSVTIEVSC